MKKIIIEDEIFNINPDFYRGLVIVRQIENHKSYKRIRKLLKKEIDQQVNVDIKKDPRLLSWDTVHRKFGSNPNKQPPSIKYL